MGKEKGWRFTGRWEFCQSGMTPMQALETATISPARHLGMEKFGFSEPGKLADLVIIDGNPLEDVRRTDQIDKVMLNGRLYDAATLAEEGQGSVRRPIYGGEVCLSSIFVELKQGLED